MTDQSSTPDPSAEDAQPTWGSGQNPPSAAAEGLDPKIGAMLSYLLFGWIGGLVMFFTQKHPEVRFHAAQSIIVFGALTVLSFALSVLFPAMLFSGMGSFAIVSFVSFALNAVGLVLWILLSIKGYNLEHFKLPVAGDMAERWAAAQPA